MWNADSVQTPETSQPSALAKPSSTQVQNSGPRQNILAGPSHSAANSPHACKDFLISSWICRQAALLRAHWGTEGPSAVICKCLSDDVGFSFTLVHYLARCAPSYRQCFYKSLKMETKARTSVFICYTGDKSFMRRPQAICGC